RRLPLLPASILTPPIAARFRDKCLISRPIDTTRGDRRSTTGRTASALAQHGNWQGLKQCRRLQVGLRAATLSDEAFPNARGDRRHHGIPAVRPVPAAFGQRGEVPADSDDDVLALPAPRKSDDMS